MLRTLLLLLAAAPAIAADAPTVDAVPPTKPVTDYALRTAKELTPTRAVVYKTGADDQRELRIFESRDHQPADRRPCFLAIHGGGWSAGTPDVM